MYTPLEYLNQLENFIKVIGAPVGYAERVNEDAREFTKEAVGLLGRGLFIETVAGVWNAPNTSHDSMPFMMSSGTAEHYEDYRKEQRKVVRELKREMSAKLGISNQLSLSDFTEQLISCDIYNTWGAFKRAYKIKKDMLTDLCETDLPKNWAYEIVCKSPCDCFYIDYSEDPGMFGDNVLGTFVSTGYVQERKSTTWLFTHLLEGKDRIGTIRSMFTSAELFGTDGIEKALSTYPAEIKCQLDTAGDPIVRFYDHKFFKFFINFMLYINAQNREVIYTERTRKAYRPRKEHDVVKNKIREVEEFSVGSPISSVQKRYAECKDAKDSAERRSISSHWRSAHWHKYHKKNEQGEDTIIVHWIPPIYVKGTAEKVNAVHISNVTR